MSVFSYNHRFYPIHITANVIVTTFLAVVAAVSTMIADIAIQGELALSDTESIWLTTLNLLGVNTVVPTGNWFASRFGFNRMYTYGILIFTFASLMAALSTNFIMIASARFIEGVGAGFIFPVGLTLIVKSMPKNRIGLAINLYIGIAFGLGLSLGIYLSGLLTQFHSWRDIFFLIVPVGFLASLSCWACRKKPEPDRVFFPFDFWGFIAFAGFVSALLMALTLGPIKATDEGWREPYILALFAISLISLILCIFIESHHSHPLIPLSLFKDPIFSVSLAAMFLLGMATFGSMYVSILYMIKGLFYEKVIAGEIAMIYGIAIGAFSIISSYLAKIIPIPYLTFLGLTLLIFSYFLNNELSWLTGYKQVLTLLFIRGAGIGFSLGPTTQMALHNIANELQAAAATILTFFRQVGGTYGGTLISIISIKRTIFHTARFGEQTNSQLPAYKLTLKNLVDKLPNEPLAKAEIINNIQTQAFIQGLNDALIVFGYVATIISIILLFLILYQSRKKAIP